MEKVATPTAMELHQQAKLLAPEAPGLNIASHLSKPNRRVIAVERHDVNANELASDPTARFVWIKGRDVSLRTSSSLYFEHIGLELTSVPENHGRQDLLSISGTVSC